MALNELFAAAMQNVSGKASELLRKPVSLSVQGVQEGGWETVGPSLSGYSLALPASFSGDVSGTGVILLDQRYAALVAELMFENEPAELPAELSELQITAASEALAQMVGAIGEGLGRASQRKVMLAAGEPTPITADGQAAARGVIKEGQASAVQCEFKIGEYEATPLVFVLPQSAASALTAARAAGSGSPEMTLGAPQAAGAGGAQRVQPVQFGTVTGTAAQEATSGNLELLLDVPLEVTVELGRATRRVRDVLSLGPGSVVELSKLAGEPVDLLVNGKPIARAEVVVIDENFAVRITEILAREERLAAGGL